MSLLKKAFIVNPWELGKDMNKLVLTLCFSYFIFVH